MDNYVGPIVLLGFAVLAIVQKIKQMREEEQIRRDQGQKRSFMDDLPEETRRQIYGDSGVPTATLDDEDEDDDVTVVPIPVARERQARPAPVPRSSQPAQQTRQAATPPPLPPRTQERAPQPQQRRPQPQPQRQEQPQRQRQPQQRQRQAQPRQTQRRPARQQRAPRRQPAAQSPRRGTRGASMKASKVRAMLDTPNGLHAAIVLTEIIGPPVSMR